MRVVSTKFIPDRSRPGLTTIAIVEIGLLLVEEVEERGECADRERRGKDLEKDYDPKLVAQVLLGQSAEMQKQAPVVQPPVSGDDYDTEELLLPHEDNRPLTQEELRQRIMNRILQKEEALHAGKSKEARSAKLSALSSHRQSTLESTF